MERGWSGLGGFERMEWNADSTDRADLNGWNGTRIKRIGRIERISVCFANLILYLTSGKSKFWAERPKIKIRLNPPNPLNPRSITSVEIRPIRCIRVP